MRLPEAPLGEGDLFELVAGHRSRREYSEGLVPGVYRYFSDQPALVLVREGDFASSIRSAGLDQEMLSDAAFVLVFGLARQGSVTGARDFRVGALAAGAGGAFGYLAAEALELGTCGVGAFENEAVAKLLGEREARPVFLMAAGAR